MKKAQFFNLLEEVAEKEDISLNAFEKQEDKTYFIEFEYWSDLGEDVIISLNIEKLTKDEILHEMWIFSENFDADEHAEMLIQNRGKYGIPESIRDLINDADEQAEKLASIYTTMEEIFNK